MVGDAAVGAAFDRPIKRILERHVVVTEILGPGVSGLVVEAAARLALGFDLQSMIRVRSSVGCRGDGGKLRHRARFLDVRSRIGFG